MGAESDPVSSAGRTVAATPTAQVRRHKEELEPQLTFSNYRSSGRVRRLQG
jgi:hypothetical protein